MFIVYNVLFLLFAAFQLSSSIYVKINVTRYNKDFYQINQVDRDQTSFIGSLQVDGKHVCTAAILTNRVIITAFVCFDKPPLPQIFRYDIATLEDVGVVAKVDHKNSKRVCEYGDDHRSICRMNAVLVRLLDSIRFDFDVLPTMFPTGKRIPLHRVDVVGWCKGPFNRTAIVRVNNLRYRHCNTQMRGTGDIAYCIRNKRMCNFYNGAALMSIGMIVGVKSMYYHPMRVHYFSNHYKVDHCAVKNNIMRLSNVYLDSIEHEKPTTTTPAPETTKKKKKLKKKN